MIDILTYSPDKPLLFTQLSFWIFFFVVFVGFGLTHKKIAVRNMWLFAVSVFFYYKLSGWFFVLVLMSVVVNFFIGGHISKLKSEKKRKGWLAAVVVYNLLWLVYYKYAYLFADWTNQIFGTQIIVHDWLGDALCAIGSGKMSFTDIMLPVGISFYTFQAISYCVDIYRKHIEPLNSIVDFGFYITFFPQLVAGPIVRASSFIPQIERPFVLDSAEFGQGLFLILNGLIKKIVIADYISVNFVDRVFDSPLSYSGFENLMGVYGYAIQIYCDFSGYTDIAIGLALLMGFHLSPNFASPYKANNFTDFWRRWHISLSSWLRDYLYIPLGGNRKGRMRTYINLVIVMVLGGLWHGANLKFIVWGVLHGLYLAIDKLVDAVFRMPKQMKWFAVLVTFNVTAFTWIVFRAGSMADALTMLTQIFSNTHFEQIMPVLSAYRNVFVLVLLAYVVHWLPEEFKDWYRGKFATAPLLIQGLIVMVVVFVLVQFRTTGLQPFIYFQF